MFSVFIFTLIFLCSFGDVTSSTDISWLQHIIVSSKFLIFDCARPRLSAKSINDCCGFCSPSPQRSVQLFFHVCYLHNVRCCRRLLSCLMKCEVTVVVIRASVDGAQQREIKLHLTHLYLSVVRSIRLGHVCILQRDDRWFSTLQILRLSRAHTTTSSLRGLTCFKFIR